MTEVAKGDINITLNDGDARAGLDRVEAEFQAKMAAISRMEAKAKIDAETARFDEAVDRVKAKIDSLKAERAEVVVKANKDDLDRKIAAAELSLTRLNGRKAEVKIEVQGAEKALAAEAAIAKAESDRQKAYDTYSRRRAQVQAAEARASKDAEKAAYLESTAATRAELAAAKQQQRIAQLRKEYAGLTDKIEKVAQQRTPFGKEAKIKLGLDEDFLRSRMAAVKAELNAIGGHPPVHVKVDTDEGFLQRTKIKLLGFLNDIGNKADNIGNIRISAGPISGTARTLAAAAAALSPILTSLGGGLVSLIGVLGTGFVGAASVASGVVTGLALNFGGMFAALKPAIADFSAAEAATKAYATAIQKYGKDSKQAKTAQDQMNSTLKSVSPQARDAAIGLHLMSTEWAHLTGATAKRDFGSVLSHGIETAAKLMPGLAHNTDTTMNIVSSRLDNVLAKMRSPSGIKMFDSLGSSANKFLLPALSGLQHIGAAFIHVGEAGARIFAGPAGDGFRKWASDLDKATQPGAKLDGEITRLGSHAGDLIHLFGSLGKLLGTVLNGSADAGDNLVRSMSHATDSWNKFLQTGKGQQDMTRFFNRSADDVKALAGALGPLIASFVQWSNLLAPFTTGLLHGISFVARLIEGITKLVGLGGPLGALGATIGAIFAVNKIGSFIGMLVKAVSLMRELGAIGTIKALGTGAFNIGSGLVGGARTAGATIAVSMTEAGSAVAAEIRAALMSGGAAAGAEIGTAEAAGGAAGGAASAAEGAAGAAAGGGLLGKGLNFVKGIFGAGGGAAAASEIGTAEVATEGLTASVAGLGAVLAPETLGISALVAGAGLLAFHFLKTKDAASELEGQLHQGATANARLKASWGGLTTAMTESGSQLHASNIGLKELKEQLDHTHKGTVEHERAELSYNEALRQNIRLRSEYQTQSKAAETASGKDVEGLEKAVAATQKLSASKHQQMKEDKTKLGGVKEFSDAKELAKIEEQRIYQAGQLTQALNRQAAVSSNLVRSYRGLPELSKQAEQAIGNLARTGSKPIALKIATKFTSSNDVASVSKAASSALGAGLSQKVVMKVVADASSAKQALQSLSNAQIAAKYVHISASDGPKVVALLQHIDGIKLSAKQVAIISHGGPAAVATLDHILGIKIPTKNSNIVGHDGVSAIARRAAAAILGVPTQHNSKVTADVSGLGAVQSLGDAIAGIASKTVTIATHTVNTVTNAVSKVFGKAEGGVHEPWEKTTGGKYNRPTLLVGEENRNEYVIATNPAYRGDNVVYLKEAADALGYNVDEAAKGKKSAKKAPAKKGKGKAATGDSAPGTGTTAKAIVALKIPDPYSAAAVPMGQVEEITSKIDQALSSEKNKLVTLKNQKDSALKSLHHAKESEHGKKGKSLASAKKSTKHAEETLAEYERGIRVVEKTGGVYRHVNYKSIPQLEADSRTAHADKGRLEAANKEIEHLNNVIGTDQTRLQNIASEYNRTGDNKLKEGANGWNAILGDRRGSIGKLQGILGNAKRTAQAIASKYPSAAFTALIDSIEKEEAATESASVETTSMETYGPEGSSAAEAEGPPSADKYVEELGMKGTLASLNKAYAIAQTNNMPDNPNTPQNEELPTIQDDLASSLNLQSFWEGVLAKAEAGGAPDETITEIANDVTSARGTYQGLAEQVAQDKGVAESNAYNDMVNFSQVRQELYTNYGGNFKPIWAQAPTQVPAQPAFTGGGGQNAVAQTTAQPNVVNMHVNNHFQQPPPEPHAWSQGVAWELGAAL